MPKVNSVTTFSFVQINCPDITMFRYTFTILKALWLSNNCLFCCCWSLMIFAFANLKASVVPARIFSKQASCSTASTVPHGNTFVLSRVEIIRYFSRPCQAMGFIRITAPKCNWFIFTWSRGVKSSSFLYCFLTRNSSAILKVNTSPLQPCKRDFLPLRTIGMSFLLQLGVLGRRTGTPA